jgi:hypothetical protein
MNDEVKDQDKDTSIVEDAIFEKTSNMLAVRHRSSFLIPDLFLIPSP